MSNEVASTTVTSPGLFKLHGWVGILIMAAGEWLLIQDSVFVKSWFTPIMWSGYILFADALLYKIQGFSLIINRRRQFLFMLVFSVMAWLIFEAYNLHLRNWRYIGLTQNLVSRYVGYVWSFATIWPGVLLTYALIRVYRIFGKIRLPTFQFKRSILYVICMAGLICLLMPFLVPRNLAAYLFGPVWIGFIFFLDPINYFIGANSLFRDLEEGKVDKLLALFVAGAICGLLWEFWNYWATAKWIYTLPFLQNPKIFEMPLFGFLGFLPFGVEIYVMWALAVKVFKMQPTFGD